MTLLMKSRKRNLRGGGLWLVVSCNRAAPDASSFLKEGRRAEVVHAHRG